MGSEDKRLDNDNKKQNYEEAHEEHVESTVNTGNGLKSQSKNSTQEWKIIDQHSPPKKLP